MSDNRGISYYIPPELKEKGKQIYNLFSAVDPVQGIMRGMSASGRAADSDLSPEQRRSALIEAGVETASPLMMMGLGALAKQPVKATLMDVLAPTGATKDIAEDALADPSRRNFLAGAAAAVPVAALAPDLITDVVTKATKVGSRAAINPLDMAMANIRALKDQIDEQYQILDEIESAPDAANLNSKDYLEMLRKEKAADDADAFIFRSQDEIVDEAINILEDMTPADLKGASDEAIEEVVSIQYDPRNGQFFDFGSLEADNLPLNPKYKMLSEEIQRRGLDKAKDRNGIDRFTHARAFVEDVNDKLNEGITFSSPNPSMQMVRETPDFADDFLKTNEKKINDENIQEIILNGRIDKKSTDEINQNIVRYAEKNNISAPKRVFDNPKVEYVSTQEIADNIAQFNYPRYDVGKFGGDLPYGNLGENPDILKRFEDSGKETLKENIFNEGIKEPIEIELLLSNGEISIGSGHHRLQAAIELGLPEVPVFIRTRNLRRDGSKSFDTSVAQVKPGRIDTSGINKPTDMSYNEDLRDYSYSELDISNRFISPKETGEEIQRRGGSGYTDPETGEFFDRRRPKYYTPMREGFFRRTDKKAMGGPVEGIASLSDTARDMYRGPRGIGAYQQFMSG
jgi:hypothetical protein